MSTYVKAWLPASKMDELRPFSYFSGPSETYLAAILKLQAKVVVDSRGSHSTVFPITENMDIDDTFSFLTSIMDEL